MSCALHHITIHYSVEQWKGYMHILVDVRGDTEEKFVSLLKSEENLSK